MDQIQTSFAVPLMVQFFLNTNIRKGAFSNEDNNLISGVFFLVLGWGFLQLLNDV